MIAGLKALEGESTAGDLAGNPNLSAGSGERIDMAMGFAPRAGPAIEVQNFEKYGVPMKRG